MKAKKLLSLLVSILVPLSAAYADDPIRPGYILYKIREGATAAELRSLNGILHSRVHSVSAIEGLGVKVVELNAPGIEVSTSAMLRASGAVHFAEPDRLVAHSAAPNDPGYGNQWHHLTINSESAWDTLTGAPNPEDVRACVLDTGVDLDHPDLLANLLPGYNANGLATVEDAHGHGSGTVGVIGAAGNNHIGVSGILWNVNIIPIQINISNTNSSAYISTMAEGIRWCADNGGKVANLSYGGARYATIDTAATYLRDRGGLLFMSAGNAGTFNDSASYPDWGSFVIVGATDSNDVKSSFSQYGPFVDLVAPGRSIRTTYKNGGYINYTGTSFSSPMAAGVGALIYAVDPSFAPDLVERILLDTTVDLGEPGEDDWYGRGRIDAAAAVALAMSYAGAPNEAPVASVSATPLNSYAPLEVAFDGAASFDSDGTITRYEWRFGDGNGAEGTRVNHVYDNPGSFEAVLVVTDDRGATDTASTTIVVDADPSMLLPPSGLAATVDANRVSLSWNDNSALETGYVIQRARKARGKYKFATIATTGPNVQSLVDEPQETGDYRYRVRAVSGADVSGFSNEIAVKVESLGTTPVPDPGPEPDLLAAPVLSLSVSGTDATLTWTHSCPAGAQQCSYRLERGDGKVRGRINFALEYQGPNMSATISEGSGGTYYYRVSASDGNNDSGFSDTVSVRLR